VTSTNSFVHFLELSIEAARRARQSGNHPFGAVLVGPTGEVLLEAGNTVVTGRDCTGHAETNLLRLASRQYEEEFLGQCSLYASTEPCVMCAGAIYWSGVGRVVYALSAERLYQMMENPDKGLRHTLTCREALARGTRQVEVIGPLAVAGAEEVHAGFWNATAS
jgi:tRNA(Arg) A34 adenosine deaminase TadA